MKSQSNILFRIIPNKHVRFCDSLIAIAGLLHQIIDRPMSTDEIWVKFQKEIKERGWPLENLSFDLMWYSLVILYSAGIIDRKDPDIIMPIRK